MHFTTSTLLAAAALIPSTIAATAGTSTKRGLVFVPNAKHPGDNQIWVQPGSDITWYYNYQTQPSPAYSNRTQEDFEFVPMAWSPSTTFLNDVTALVKGGRNIKHVMGYNEPDGYSSTGGSNVDPKVAASNWLSQIQPLAKMGIKLGAPAVTGAPSGHTWLANFFNACAALGTNCTVDFIPIHWYDNFGGLASHIGTVRAAYPNTSIWVTEYAYSNQTLAATQDFFNMSAEYFDRLTYVERYSWFGTFRTEVSNVGPNAAFLNNQGKLTDMGAWYLGKASTGVQPGGASSAATKASVAGLGLLGAAAVGFLML
ncbi:glycosyl hydrolase catalytic core-domain-containing protein [Tricladium varicosporioides]|nr:glycosyl hydrolase catalytic core-domain-containing protein [Hymenoscyphus varicosporioides]